MLGSLRLGSRSRTSRSASRSYGEPLPSPLSAHGRSGGNKGVYAEVQWPGVGLGALNALSIRYDMQYGVWGVRALGHFTDHSGFLLDAT